MCQHLKKQMSLLRQYSVYNQMNYDKQSQLFVHMIHQNKSEVSKAYTVHKWTLGQSDYNFNLSSIKDYLCIINNVLILIQIKLFFIYLTYFILSDRLLVFT